MKAEEFHSWGRLQGRYGKLSDPGTGEEIRIPDSPFLPVGLGRSYGDVCSNRNGTLLGMRQRSRILEANWETGVVHLEAGVALGDIIGECLRHGWFPPVLPGTRHVTIGGAVANDVHGKNHHRAGTFGNHLNRLWLQRSDQNGPLECSSKVNPDLFKATIAGLGLTGIILSAEIQLTPASGPFLDVEYHPFDRLEQFSALTEASDREWEYTVAWVDLIRARAEQLPGVFMRGNPASEAGEPKQGRRGGARLRLPFVFPFNPFNRFTCGAFNRLYRMRQKLRSRAFQQLYGPFFHPLDAIDDWNKLYGPKGFYQYQCVIPKEAGLDPFREIFKQLKGTGSAVPLAVLKQTGNFPSAGTLSFPLPGWTLAMDLPNTGKGTLALFASLDRIVREAGGRLYPAKDATMGPDFFQASYPEWPSLEQLKDPGIHSDYWSRVTAPID